MPLLFCWPQSTAAAPPVIWDRLYLTVLTERGANLSGGQRQRIAIARALYADTEVLLLDEPAASLDVEAEGRLAAVLERLRGEGKTIVMAGHRGQLLDLADRTYRLHQGQVVSEKTLRIRR